ncbi:MAG: flavin reductase family protein [Akkermansiaceae bacterium]
MIINADDIKNMEKLVRVQFATTLPGPKPICLVGTRSAAGVANLAPFSSITHLGSNPVLIGMITRPDVVQRNTLQNIMDTESWTLNHVTSDTVEKAHQCSARYPADVSEFDATGLTELTHEGVIAPFVKECPIRYALSLADIIDIPANGTKLIIGEFQLADIPEDSYSADGNISISAHDSLASTALDTYFTISEHTRLPYAKAPKSES